MNKIRSHFIFNKQEKSGIFFLLLLIFSCQLIYYFIQSSTIFSDSGSFVIDEKTQNELEALKAQAATDNTLVQHRFNPNFIDEFKGYTLGMTTEEITSFLRYRALGKFVNTPEEFQKVSGISDGKLQEIAPYFKFPDWQGKINKKEAVKRRTAYQNTSTAEIQDINSATADELMTVYGIGETLSKRIIKFRDALGGFLVNDQLYDVYGLEPEVVKRALKKFSIIEAPSFHKINLNTANASEIASIIYISNELARKIIDYRTDVGGFSSFDELRAIPDFPLDKIERIRLYLSL